MQPTQALIDSLAELLAEDVAFLAAAAAKHVHLVIAPFTPGPTTAYGDLTIATFDGYAALNAAAGAQQFFTDAESGRRVVQLIEPVGGWHWLTTGVTDLPQTIHGYVVTDLANAVTLGSALLDDPITLSGSGEAIDIDQIRFTFGIEPLT